MALRTFLLKNSPLRFVPLFGIILCVFLVILALKWSFGETIARTADTPDLAEFSTKLSPSDPQTYYSLATFEDNSFLPQDFEKALANYEKAVSVSPFDYRLWLVLGRAKERSDDSIGAEKALRKAIELAPNYAEPHWVFGNFLIRNGDENEAFAEIRKAVDQDQKYANPAVVTAWQILDGDTNRISQKIGDSDAIKAEMAPFLVNQKRFDEAFSFWNSIPDGDKKGIYKKNGEALIGQFIAVNSYRNALIVQNQISSEGDEKFAVGSIYNGDFEKEVKTSNAKLFDWSIADGAQPQVGLDGNQKHGGSRSLILIYNSQTGKDLRQIEQTIGVEGGKTYHLDGFYRTDLKSLGTLKWDVTDAVDGKTLGSSNVIELSKADWTPFSLEFNTAVGTQAVNLRLSSITCKQAICPTTGKIWFDDLSLK